MDQAAIELGRVAPSFDRARRDHAAIRQAELGQWEEPTMKAISANRT
jgi:hypothetical protein